MDAASARRLVAAEAGAVVTLLAVQVGALAMVDPFRSAGYRSVENPQDPANSLVYVGLLLVATGVMLAAIRLGSEWVLRAVLLLAAASVSWYVFSIFLAPVALALSVPVAIVAAVAGAGLAVALYVYPEWYVLDAAGVVMGIGAAGLFGISFGVLPAVLLLTALAVYDAISVYGTEHMLTLAEGVMDLKVPVVLVLPVTRGYSFLDAEESGDEDGTDEDTGEGAEDGDRPAIEQRDALFVGLGDVVIPTVLVASAAAFLETPVVGPAWLTLTVPALGAALGTVVGMVTLVALVLRGRAHAGLPLLNGGAILGYLAGALAVGITPAAALGL
jgi:presenilin-like A22 family membrane protease